ncbi:MAG: hypothetical protein M3416_01355 [Acidobacteriota bacterium]|nr:hypothetical protein [Acidobacteriota bacterium]
MSEELNTGERAAPQTGTLTCATCQTEFTVATPELVVINYPALSQVVGLHPQPFRCPGCGEHYLPLIAGAQVAWNWAAVEPPKEASRLVLPPGLRRGPGR